MPAALTADDANGNTLTDPSGKSYSWDFENRLTQVTVPQTGGGSTIVAFKYDPFGRRIQKSGPLGTTNYLYDGARLMEEVDGAGNVLARYAQGLIVDEPLSEFRSGGASYYEADVLGSITSLSNSSAALADTYIYDSYGNLTASTGSLSNPFQYTGRDYDPESGLRYYRTRYYDPSNGRFTSEDLARFDGGINFYRYVGNSPIRFLDPYGLSQVNPQDMASLINLFPCSTAQGGAGVLIPLPCIEVRKIIEQNGFYSNDNWSSWNPFLFFDPLFHRGGWEFRKKDGMHIRMKYPSAPCDKNCTLDESPQRRLQPNVRSVGTFRVRVAPRSRKCRRHTFQR